MPFTSAQFQIKETPMSDVDPEVPDDEEPDDEPDEVD
jgi:hypothetical protein